MPMPKILKVGLTPFRCLVTSLKIEEDVELLGSTDILRQTIELEEALTPERLRITALHEALHAVLFNAGIQREDEEILPEKFIRVATHGLLQLLRENPKFIRFLVEPL